MPCGGGWVAAGVSGCEGVAGMFGKAVQDALMTADEVVTT